MAKFKKFFEDKSLHQVNTNLSATEILEPIGEIESIELYEEDTSITSKPQNMSVSAEKNPLRYTEEIPVSLIKYANNNPFAVNDNSTQGIEDFETLKNSINSVGLIHNLVVNKVGNDYYIVSGERRLRAVKELNWKTVPCTVMQQLDNSTAQEMLFLANIDIRHYTPYEELNYVQQLGELYQQMLSEGKLVGAVRDNIATKLNKSKRQVSKYIFINKNISLLSNNEINELKLGEMSINKAYMIIKDRQDVNNTIAEMETQQQKTKTEDITDFTKEEKTVEPVSIKNTSNDAGTVSENSDFIVKEETTNNHKNNILADRTNTVATKTIEDNNIIDIITNSNGLKKYKAKSIDGSLVSGFLLIIDNQHYIVVNSQMKEQDNSKRTTRISVTMFPVSDDTLEKIEG